jgi:hypothetical protein
MGDLNVFIDSADEYEATRISKFLDDQGISDHTGFGLYMTVEGMSLHRWDYAMPFPGADFLHEQYPYEDMRLDEILFKVREVRNKMLAATDYIFLADSSFAQRDPTGVRVHTANFRQALRDVTDDVRASFDSGASLQVDDYYKYFPAVHSNVFASVKDIGLVEVDPRTLTPKNDSKRQKLN